MKVQIFAADKAVKFESTVYEKEMVKALRAIGKSHSFIQRKIREYRIKEATYIPA